MLASCAQEDSQVLIWSPKSKQPVICINDSGDAAIRDFKWSNMDPNQSSNTSANILQPGYVDSCSASEVSIYLNSLIRYL